MSKNRIAQLRYKTIDQCLRRRHRQWTLQDLVDAVTHTLHEHEGIPTISLRTIQLDIETMRSGALGYTAPIVVVSKKYYTYADENFSAAKPPLSIDDLEKQGAQEIICKIKNSILERLQSKPLHTSQHIENQSDSESILTFKTIINPDLESTILGYGENIKIIAPDSFKQRMIERITLMMTQYKK